MFIAQYDGLVNTNSPKMSTSGRNERTPEEWLWAILHSGQVTRIGQHLALVLFHLANEKGVASLSMRDLQSITGWGRTTICDHLGEIQTFIKTTFGKGRAKSIFELQGMITEAIEQARSVRQPDTNENGHHSSVRQPDTIPDAKFVSGSRATTADTTADTKPSVREPDTTADTNPRSVRQPDTKPVMGGTIGGESLSNFNSTTHSVEQDAAREEHVGHGVVVNCETIRHAHFTISIPGVALRCQASGLSTAEIKSKLTGIALQWAAEIESGKKPKDVLPVSMNSALARAVMGDRFQEDVHATRKSRQYGKAPAASDEMRSIEAIVGKDKFAEIMRGRQ